MTPLPANPPGPDQPAPRVRHRRGFTLIEILLVVALLGLGALLLVNGVTDITRVREPRSDEIFWQGVTAARQLALETDQTVSFRYDRDKRLLTWSAGPESLHSLAFSGRLLEFLPVTGQGTVLIGGQLAETGSLTVVRFYPDGGCDAFRAQLTDASDHRTVLAIDPWTCAPMLTTAAP